MPEEQRGSRRPVWVRGRRVTEECPKSLITAESIAWLEKFFVWNFASRRSAEELTAREAEAFSLLDVEYRAEVAGGE